MSRTLRIYIAGPYTAASEEDRLRNVERAIDAGISVFRKGHLPYVPHLTHYVDLRAQQKGISLTWEEYIQWDLAWLSLCDALLYLSSSPGADLEMEAARRAGKTVFRSLDEIPVAAVNRARGRKGALASR